jgi:hypothetical protein
VLSVPVTVASVDLTDRGIVAICQRDRISSSCPCPRPHPAAPSGSRRTATGPGERLHRARASTAGRAGAPEARAQPPRQRVRPIRGRVQHLRDPSRTARSIKRCSTTRSVR